MFQQIEGQRRFGPFVLHLFVAVLGTLVITGTLSAVLTRFAGLHFATLVALGPLFLLPLLSGITLGYFVAKLLPSRGAMWVWVLPAVLLVVNIIGMLTSPYERAEIWLNEFGPHSQCTACLDEELLTAPLVGCIGYAIGAGLRKRSLISTV